MDTRPTEMVTRCGRRVSTGRFRLPTTPIERVILRIDPHDDCCDTVWTSLTADEALALAHALVTQVHAARAR
jgi:hypothetical protein